MNSLGVGEGGGGGGGIDCVFQGREGEEEGWSSNCCMEREREQPCRRKEVRGGGGGESGHGELGGWGLRWRM